MGGLTVIVAGVEVAPIRSKKTRALLGYLAAAPGTRHSRDRLAALLWSEMPEDRARHSLRQCVTNLRKVFGAHHDRVLEVDADAITLVAGAVDVDVVSFRADASSDAPDRWQRAVELYRGELLAGLSVAEDPFDDWLFDERRQLERLAGRACLHLGETSADRGDRAAAEAAFVRRLELDPCSEEAHLGLMSMFAAAGRRSEAIRQYETCVAALRRELDIAPSAKLERAYQQLLSDEAPEPSAPLPLPSRPSIAVLPFDNLSGDPAQLFLSDGIAEDIIVALSRFDALMVIARPASFSFRDRAVDPASIGRTLGVRYVLQGSVRRGGDQLRVAAQLFDATTGETVWASTYDRAVQDLFAMQDELVQTIVATLVSRVEAHAAARVRVRPTSSLEAYECLLKGKYHHHRYSESDNDRAQACLSRALELDPDLALAHAWMACTLAQSCSFGAAPDTIDHAYQYALTAHRLNDGDSECHRVLAAYYLLRRRFDDCQLHQQRAMELNPNDDRIVAQMGEILGFLGQPVEAIEWLERAMRLNPYHPDGFRYDLGRALYDAGRHAEAVEALRGIGARRTGHSVYLAAAAARAGNRARAAEALAEARRSQPDLDVRAFAGGLPYRDRATCDALAAVLSSIDDS